MGQSRDGGYQKLATGTADQTSLINQLIAQYGGQGGLQEQAMNALKGYLPGGEAFSPIEAQAREGFQQQTIPSIVESLGQGQKGSSALNQALASAGSGLESQLAAQKSQMGMQAIGMSQPYYQQAMESQFAYQPKQKPFWQEALLGGIGAGGKIAGAYAGRPGL